MNKDQMSTAASGENSNFFLRIRIRQGGEMEAGDFRQNYRGKSRTQQ